MPKTDQRSAPPAEIIPSDDCAVDINGTPYYPHLGQWVEVIRGPKSQREMKVSWNFNAFQVELDALRADQEEARRALNMLIEKLPKAGSDDDLTEEQKREAARIQVAIQDHIDELAALSQKRYDRISERYDQFSMNVADHLVDWNWTNAVGRTLAKPDGTIGPLQDLNPDEVYYLRQVVEGESPNEKKSV